MRSSDLPFALRPGTMITGYEITRTIGAGGFGITYEGYNPITERRVAIKEFFPRGIASRNDATRIAYSQGDDEIVAWALKRFAESTNRLAKLKHPNIIEVLNYVAENGTGYMVMELVEGETLEDWVRSRPAPPALAELGPIFDPVFDALEYVHTQGLIHRDIAPDNVMIRTDGRPVLIDFGALKQIANQALAHGPSPKSFGVSKANYSPPEQSDDSGSIDPRMDIYSLAATIYRALAGQPPVDADKRKTDTALKGQDSYVPLAQATLVPVPPEFSATIDAALSLRPLERPSTIAEFRERLAARASDQPAILMSEPATRIIQPQAPLDAQSAAPMPVYSEPAPPPPYQPAASADQGQPYVPSGNATPEKRSGISFANIAAVVLILVGSAAVLLHRPIANFLDQTMGTRFMADSREQPQKQQPQKQETKQQPQKQVTRDTSDSFRRANELLGQGNYRAALEEYNNALRTNPRNVAALVGRGLAYENLEQADNALKDYNEALRYDRAYAGAYLGRGRIYLVRKDFVAAYSDFSDAARLEPRNALARDGRGAANERLGRKDEAIREYREALRLNPNLNTSRDGLRRLGG